MFAEPETLGRRYSIIVSGASATLELPLPNPDNPKAGDLSPPSIAAESLSRYVNSWGSAGQDARMQLAEISSVLVNVEVHAEVDGNIASFHAGGEDIQNLVRSVQRWVESFIEWIWCLTSQSIDKDHPDPKVFAPNSANMVYAVAAGATASRASITSSMVVSPPDFDGHPSSERAVDHKTLETASTRAGSQLPPILELLWQLDGEHRRRRRHLHRPTSGTLDIPARLTLRAPEPGSQLTSRVNHRDARSHQRGSRVDPRGVFLTTSSTTSHDVNILLNMSLAARDTRQTLQPAIPQRHLKAEVAHCVGGVLAQQLAV
jgi:hypothetical protein